jgi:hypothetical protein
VYKTPRDPRSAHIAPLRLHPSRFNSCDSRFVAAFIPDYL